MNQVNDILQELKSMGSPLADLSRKMPYNVPANYFENIEFSLQDTINSLNQSDSESNWSKKIPYTTPIDYFEHLPSVILKAVVSEDSFANLPVALPFDIPVKYFESFPEKMLQVAKASEQTKKEVKKIKLKHHYVLAPIRWAAAAVILICISFGSYITFFSNTQSVTSERILASVPNSEIQDYLQSTYRVNVDRIANNNEIATMQLDSKDIAQYLNETGWDAAE